MLYDNCISINCVKRKVEIKIVHFNVKSKNKNKKYPQNSAWHIEKLINNIILLVLLELDQRGCVRACQMEERETGMASTCTPIWLTLCVLRAFTSPKFQIFILNFLWPLTLDDSIQAAVEEKAREELSIEIKDQGSLFGDPPNFRDCRRRKKQRRKQS